MSNPTTPFSWQMPTATDLVTDLPADFEVFGQAVATSMQDLLGGTTGQILAKASATDMDFAWITNDVGDITAVTAGTGITGGGTSGAVTVSFDQANYGGGQYAAGKNKIINGDLGIWQRGTSLSNAGTVYGADKWQSFSYSGSSTTLAQQTFTPGAAPVSGYEGQFFLRCTSTNTQTIVWQNIEDVRAFAGQTVAVSFYAKVASAVTVSTSFEQNFGSGGSGTVTTSVPTTLSATTSWQRFTGTVAIPSISGKTIGTSSYLRLNIFHSGINNALDIWGVQLEAGSTATPFQTATGSIQGELAACQRYYWRTTTSSTQRVIGTVAYANSAIVVSAAFTNPVPLRVPATSVDSSNLIFQSSAGTQFTMTAVTGDPMTETVSPIYATVVGATAGSVGRLLTIAAGTSYIGFNAEL